jgi:hypothetical protein
MLQWLKTKISAIWGKIDLDSFYDLLFFVVSLFHTSNQVNGREERKVGEEVEAPTKGGPNDFSLNWRLRDLM